MANWTAVQPAPPLVVYELVQYSNMQYANYVPDVYPLQEATYWNAFMSVSGVGPQGGWRGQLTLDTYPPGFRNERFFPAAPTYTPRSWAGIEDSVPAVTIEGMILEQARTAACLPWTQTQWFARAIIVGLRPTIPARSTIQVRFWFTTNDWRSSPVLLIGVPQTEPLTPSWEALLHPLGFHLADPDRGVLAQRPPKTTPIIRQQLPRNTGEATKTVDAVVPGSVSQLLMLMLPGEAPHSIIEDCQNPSAAPPTPWAIASAAIRDIRFRPQEQEAEEPREITRTWTARQELAKNTLR